MCCPCSQTIGFILSHFVKHAHMPQLVCTCIHVNLRVQYLVFSLHVQSTKRSKSKDSYIVPFAYVGKEEIHKYMQYEAN